MSVAKSRSAQAARSAGRLLFPLLATVGVAMLTATAAAHDAKPTAALPQGWSYPFACCANYDCKEVPQTSIGERPEGYVIKGTGEVVAYSDKRVKNSPDGEYHWCAHQAGLDAGKTICLFVPPPSY
ncbi:hypothetical protein [Mesorhizobium sp. ORS 3428]|uniref:hypothetical protein n=1 Tax=Mesorhizobium sp. ORS 3428 TaxID=540997 RepID=UPI0008D93B1B|nr:hypothetical protein [Mesorhizobium sp. ORS 3428]OHV88381.1 hypothetical protein ORS3428_04480 [Mesorhizobium sp. ORS 3428]